MDKAIGGYFGLELRHGEHYHKDAIRLNTARNCFEYVLRSRQYTKVYIPYYTCEVMLEPLNKLSVQYEFYSVNEKLEPVVLPNLKENEAFLYTNYYGLKQDCVLKLASCFGNRLIVDNAQAFYAKPIHGIDTFYSARKFFGVADGAYLYTECRLDEEFGQDQSYDRMTHLLKRADVGAEFGYQDFRTNDDSLINNPIRRMSNLTEKILCSIDYEYCREKRIENYRHLDGQLKSRNKIHFELADDAVPMVYPYLTDDTNLRNRLIENKIFVAKYWPNVLEWCGENDIEYKLTKYMLPLPCDQRYGEEEMNGIIELIYASQK
ncbi:MAG: hypothetical protein MJZ97_05530 [Bacteroidales bacterium]|nr:hypothetical protein [Bacteroidales bacterium]